MWRNTEDDGIGPTDAFLLPVDQPSRSGEVSCAEVDDPTFGHYCIYNRAVVLDTPCLSFFCVHFGFCFANGTDGALDCDFPDININQGMRTISCTQTQIFPRRPLHSWYRSGLRLRRNDEPDGLGTWIESDSFETEGVGETLKFTSMRPNQVVGFDLVYAFDTSILNTDLKYMCSLNEEGDFDDWDGPTTIYSQTIGIIASGHALGSEPDGAPFLVFSEDDPSDELIVLRGASRAGNCSSAPWTEVARINITFCPNIAMDEDVKRLSNGNYGFIFACSGEPPRFVRSTAPTAEGPWEVEPLSQIAGIPAMSDTRGTYISFIVGGTGNVFCSYQAPAGPPGEFFVVTIQSIRRDTFI